MDLAIQEYIDSISLTNSQKSAILSILDIKNYHKDIVISGAAGTGKTFLLNVIIKCLKIRNPSTKILSSAPTHQAKKVLSDSIGLTAYTIHSVFKIHPTTYEDIIEFSSRSAVDLSEYEYLIIDEISMVDDKLFNIIMENKPSRLKLICVGDINQLQPVNNAPGQFSKFFSDLPNAIYILLKDPTRFSKENPIFDVSNSILNGNDLYKSICNNSGVMPVSSLNVMLNHYIKKIKDPEDALKYRIFAYTNDIVNKINDIIHKKIYNTDCDLVIGEYLVMQMPYIIKIKVDGETFSDKIFDNGEILKVVNFSQNEININLPGVDDFIVKYYDIGVKSVDTQEISNTIKVIYDVNSINELSYALTCSANILKNNKKKNPGLNLRYEWAKWWEIKNLFIDVKRIFCSTVHKSQGISVEGVFFYTKDITYANSIIAQQLKYVAVTRAKRFVLYY